jgi:transcriptional regulator with XRE-family HTH domain
VEDIAAGRDATRVVDAQAERIGGRIRSLRHARGLTLVQVAALTGLSHPFLSQLERGHVRASMVSLARIAKALESSQVELLDAAHEVPVGVEAVSVVRQHEGVRNPYAGGEARLLDHDGRRFHPIEFRGDSLDPGEYYEHDEDELLYVVRGTVLVDLAEHGPRQLSAGDSVHYRGGVRHRWCSADGGEYLVLSIKQGRIGAPAPVRAEEASAHE